MRDIVDFEAISSATPEIAAKVLAPQVKWPPTACDDNLIIA
jgi:hypothetical protein